MGGGRSLRRPFSEPVSSGGGGIEADSDLDGNVRRAVAEGLMLGTCYRIWQQSHAVRRVIGSVLHNKTCPDGLQNLNASFSDGFTSVLDGWVGTATVTQRSQALPHRRTVG